MTTFLMTFSLLQVSAARRLATLPRMLVPQRQNQRLKSERILQNLHPRKLKDVNDRTILDVMVHTDMIALIPSLMLLKYRRMNSKILR